MSCYGKNFSDAEQMLVWVLLDMGEEQWLNVQNRYLELTGAELTEEVYDKLSKKMRSA